MSISSSTSSSPSMIIGKNHEDDDHLLYGRWLSNPAPGDEVVISGMAGKFPESRNVGELQDNLYNKVNMSTSNQRRWNLYHPDLPKKSGKLLDIEKFDSGYFGIHYVEVNSMDPLVRLMLETAIEAIVDAGYNPCELEGTKTGVFIAADLSENEIHQCSDNLKPKTSIITGNVRSMIANRISYYLKLNGLSNVVESACSSSLFAIENAYKAIREGICEQAIVGGVHLNLLPFPTLQFSRLGVLSKSGLSKCYDVDGDGYGRSEGATIVFLQKSKDSRRIYAQVVHSKTNCDGYKPEGITFPSREMQSNLMSEVYKESNTKPSDLGYLETHGTATLVGDSEEIHAIDNVIGKSRSQALLIGSVKSNLGHGEIVSGMNSVAKVLIAMENGIIPPNLHFKTLRKGLDALEKGRLKLVTENTPLPDQNGLIAINNFGFGGANAQLLLRPHLKTKFNTDLPQDNLPRLVCVSGRRPKAVTYILDDIKNRDLDPEYVRLYHQIFSREFNNHLTRGYCILTRDQELTRVMVDVAQIKPLWLFFGTFGTLWSAIAQDLYQLPLFVESIYKIVEILAVYEVNIPEILTGIKSTNFIFDQILGNAVVQLAIADILKAVGVQPVRVIGSGVGEFLCAYFTNCLTLQETVLSVYHVAHALSHLQNKSASPHLSQNGNTEHMSLKQNLDIINLQRSNSSKEMKSLLSTLQLILTDPKPKTWLGNSNSNLASAEYFLNNLFSLFRPQTMLEGIGKGTVVVEIGNGQLKDVSSLSSSDRLLSFEDCNLSNTLVVLLEHLGSMYNLGQNLDLAPLYPKIEYPVSRGTPMISPTIKWDHSRDWYVLSYESNTTAKKHEFEVDVSLSNPNWKYIEGHMIDGRILFPAIGYLDLVWSVFATNMGLVKDDMNIVFESCRFLRASNITKDNTLTFYISIQSGSDQFEIVESNEIVVTGRVYTVNKQKQTNIPTTSISDRAVSLKTEDFYKELKLRGYNYSGTFKGVHQRNLHNSNGLIRWDGNWVTFMDAMLQMIILELDPRSLFVPVSIQKLSIDPRKHLTQVQILGENPVFPLYATSHSAVLKSGGIEIRGAKVSSIVKRKICDDPLLEKYHFVPNCTKLNIEDAIVVNVQLAFENLSGSKVKVVEFVDNEGPNSLEPLAPKIHQALCNIPTVQPEVTILSNNKYDMVDILVSPDRELSTESDCTLVVGVNILNNVSILNQCLGVIKEGGFILSRQCPNFDPQNLNLPQIVILTTYTTTNETLVMMRKPFKYNKPLHIDVSDSINFSWLPALQEGLRWGRSVLVYIQNKPTSGILGLSNCIRCEPGTQRVKCVFVDDPKAPPFDPQISFYRNQLDKNLAINVYRNGSWGTYRHLLVGELKKVESEDCFVNTLVRGDLSTLNWIEGPLRKDCVLEPEQQLIHVYYSALNFRDVMTATGKLSADVVASKNITNPDLLQGLEFSGRTSSGDRVMGIINCGAQATLLKGDTNLMWPIPEEWTMEEAASVLVVYLTVMYAILVRTRIKPGNTILIHSGTGGIGLAGIRLALHIGCRVFTTVGTKEKREFLKRLFPSIKDTHIGSSRDTSFEQMVLAQTNGRGVDYVLNSLAEEKLQASVRCLARGGCFLEIGKFDLANDTALHLDFLKKEASFHGIMLDLIFQLEPHAKKELRVHFQQCIKEGVIMPLKTTVFEKNQIEEAYRYMSSGKHIGKVMIRIREEEKEKRVIPSKMLMKGVPRYYCEPDMTYVILGGLGGFGLELANWLVTRGATKLVLSSRTGVKTGYQAYKLRYWKSQGVQVEVRTDNICTPDGCRQLLEAANNLGAVAGIFNLAVVLSDAILDNQTLKNFKTSLAPKAYATQYMDEISRRCCPQLKDFVVFSSVSCGRGNMGQTNYGMANSVMERICERRKATGLPALAIEWGAIGDVGIVAEMQKDNLEMEIGGTLQQRIASCLRVMDILMRQDSPVVASMVVAKRQEGSNKERGMVEMVAQVLDIKNMKIISMHTSLAELGMDSMTAVEVRQGLEREFQVFLSPQDVRNLTFARLQEIYEELSSSLEKPIEHVDQTELQLDGHEAIRFLLKEDFVKVRYVKMQTMAQSSAGEIPQVLLLPGVEGLGKGLEPLARNLTVNATVLQFWFDKPKSSIREIAQALVPAVEELVSPTVPFHLVAYSHGVMIALELVNILEQKGRRGHLLCLDGGPQYAHGIIKSQLDTNDDAMFETDLLSHFMSLLVPYAKVVSYKDRLLACQKFDQRWAICGEMLPQGSPFSKENLWDVVIALHGRVDLLRDYWPNFEIKSPVMLYKPRQTLISGMAEDYKLSTVCCGPVEVKVFDGNHVTMLENRKLAKAIEEFVLLN